MARISGGREYCGEKSSRNIRGIYVAISLWLFLEDLAEEVMCEQRSEGVAGSQVDA